MLDADLTKWTNDEKMAAVAGAMLMAKRLPAAFVAAFGLPAEIATQMGKVASFALTEGLGCVDYVHPDHEDDPAAWRLGAYQALSDAAKMGTAAILAKRSGRTN